MILEFPNYLDANTVKEIRETIKPFISSKKEATYNRDGNTVNISSTPELKELDMGRLTMKRDFVRNRCRIKNVATRLLRQIRSLPPQTTSRRG